MTRASRWWAFAAYLFSLPGALIVLAARRGDDFARYHARQSALLAVLMIAIPLAWAVVAWCLAWVPLVGAMLGVSLFALVLAALVALAGSWITGMVFALQGNIKPVPLVGRWAERRPPRPVEVGPVPAASVAAANELETAERRPTVDA